MRIHVIILVVLGLFGLTACTQQNAYSGPEITRVVVMKSERKLYLMHHEELIGSYEIDLGYAPEGHKEVVGDGRTPEGRYFIDRRNPNSSFYKSLGISYPNARDRARASVLGKSPGGDIFIHGERRPIDPEGDDWTAGCIALSDHEIDELYAMIPNGTVIDLYP